MNPTPTTPLTATGLAAFVLATLAVLFVALWRRDREPGMGGLGVGFALLAAWYSMASRIPPSGAILDLAYRWWWVLLGVAVVAVCLGMCNYLGRPASWRLPLAALLALPMLTSAAMLAGIALPRNLAAGLIISPFIGVAALAFRQSRHEPGAGHGFVGAAIAALPILYLLLVALGAQLVILRYVGVMSVLFFGLTLLTVSLLRRRRALEVEVAMRREAEAQLAEANQGLERAVAARTAELQDLVAGLEGFNRAVSHDLRGPLGGIAGLARLAHQALEGGDLSVALRALPVIATQADTSTRLVAALLTLARVGDARVSRTRVSLDALAREVVAQLAMPDPLAGKAAPGAAVAVATLPDVDADPDLLRPVLVNLIGNAMKFSRESASPRVDISASVQAGEVTVHVHDNGVGFDTGAAASLFQPFQRLHGTRFEGHGIGLSIVRRAVERLGGRVWADAEPGRGATFNFTLPCAA